MLMFIASFLVVLIVVDRSLGFVLKVFSHLKNGTMLTFYKLLLLGFIMYDTTFYECRNV